ncbi:MAG: hypothetical protein HYS14_03205 [Candidatus Rokubacteria bacterium]|nr:hypothetical protein [Candidatus Rokubacteria bacterium]
MFSINGPVRWIGIGALILVAVASTGVAWAHDEPDFHYGLANIAPETIPLWGPSWDHSPVTIVIQTSKGVTAQALTAITQAIDDWNHAITTGTGAPFPFLWLVPAGTPADIVVRPKTGGGMVQGQALCLTDASGFFRSCKVNISGKAFGLPNSADTVRSIALQEIGHALGLLHAEGPAASDDVMFGTVQNPPNIQISVCDVSAWAAVMAWLLTGTTPALPSSLPGLFRPPVEVLPQWIFGRAQGHPPWRPVTR